MAAFNKKPKISRGKGFSVLPIVLCSIIGASALGGSAASIWYMAKNYQESPEFYKSVNARIEVDPVAFEEGAPEVEVAQENMQKAAEKLSLWLKDSGQEMYDVSYETYGDGIRKPYVGYLNTRFNLEKVTSKLEYEQEDDKKFDNDPYLSFFSDDSFNTNNRSLVYRWYIPKGDSETKPYFSVVNLQDCFDIPKDLDKDDNNTKILNDKDGNWGIMYHINSETNRLLLNAIYNNMLFAYEESQDKPEVNDPEPEEIPNWKKPRLYIINNLEGMINEANYHLLNYKVNNRKTAYQRIYKGTDYESFSEEYFTKEDDQGLIPETRKNAYSLLSGKVWNYSPDDIQPVLHDVENYDILRWLDFTPGTKKFNLFNKYVENIITYDSEGWKKFFPKEINDTYKQEVATESTSPETTNLQFMWCTFSDKLAARKHLGNIIDYRLPVKINAIEFGNMDQSPAKFDKFKEIYSATILPPKFIDSIFGGDALVGWLSLGFLIYLLALCAILAALYRMTGVISWICLMFMLSMTQLIASLSTFVISMSFLFGMFTLSLIGFLAALGICNRMKRRLNSNEETQIIVSKTFKKSLMPTLDVSIITLIFGICFTYIAPMSLNILGLILIIGGFGLFIIMYLMNAGMHLLLFRNRITHNQFVLFGKPSNDANTALSQGNNLIPSTIDASKLEFSYYNKMSQKNIKLFDKKTFIMSMVFVGILIVGIVLFAVLGFATQSMFHSAGTVAIEYEGDLLNEPWFISTDFTWTSVVHIADTNWWYFTVDSINTQAIQAIIEHFGEQSEGMQVCVQLIQGSTNLDSLNLALISLIVGASLTSLYGAIRYNWASLVPMILGTFIIPILMLSIAAICQVKFDQTVVLGFILIFIINCVMTSNILATIQDSWSRQDAYTRAELRYIVVTALKNNWEYIWAFAIGYGAFILCFGLTAPFGCAYITLLILLGALVTLFVTPYSIAYLEYYFLCIRNNALGHRAEKAKDKVVINLDAIDEQSIEGINKFTSRKAIPIVETSKAKGEQNGQETNNTK